MRCIEVQLAVRPEEDEQAHEHAEISAVQVPQK